MRSKNQIFYTKTIIYKNSNLPAVAIAKTGLKFIYRSKCVGRLQTSNFKLQTPNFKPQTSNLSAVVITEADLKPQTSNHLNYLAHFFLSGSDEKIIIGNYLGDFIKGSDLAKYPKAIQEGVTLHRRIDEFTDAHPLTLEAKKLIREDFQKYTPVVCDVFFDYFLGVHWNTYSSSPLSAFSQNIYKVLNNHFHLLPERSKRFLYYMESNDILVQYATIKGIGKVLYGLSHRASFSSNMLGGEKVLEEKKDQLEKLFLPFFDDLIKECKQP